MLDLLHQQGSGPLLATALPYNNYLNIMLNQSKSVRNALENDLPEHKVLYNAVVNGPQHAKLWIQLSYYAFYSNV